MALSDRSRDLLHRIGDRTEPKSFIFLGKSIKKNAKGAAKYCGIPEELWLELSEEIAARYTGILARAEDANASESTLFSSIFMAGFAVGWHERKLASSDSQAVQGAR